MKAHQPKSKKLALFKQIHYNPAMTQDEDEMYVADVPSLPGCHTQAKNLSTLYKRIEEAIGLYLEVEKSKKKTIIQHKFIGIQQVEITT